MHIPNILLVDCVLFFKTFRWLPVHDGHQSFVTPPPPPPTPTHTLGRVDDGRAKVCGNITFYCPRSAGEMRGF